jgi:hypothetical protein
VTVWLALFAIVLAAILLVFAACGFLAWLVLGWIDRDRE